MPRIRAVWFTAALAALMVVASATVALAAPAVSLTTSRTVVSYPHGTYFDVAVTDADAAMGATVTVQYRPVGSDIWAPVRTVPASVTALGPVKVPVAVTFLTKTAGFRAIIEGAESDVTTVSVKAKLSAPIAPASIKAGRTATIKGFIWPRHTVGSRPVHLKMWKRVGNEWVLQATGYPTVVGKVTDGNKWIYKFTTGKADRGWWKLQVTHEDAGHVYSESRATKFRVR